VRTDEVICPYCKHSHEDSWDFFTSTSQECTEVNCDECDGEFVTCRTNSVTYSSHKKMQEKVDVENASREL
jgi:hypothetical protein